MASFTNFAALASFIAERRGSDADVDAFDGAFIEHEEMAKLSVVTEPEKLEMPCPQQARAAVELMMQTLFDVFRDTRMEEFARDLAWGFANSFHVVAKRIEGREDDAAQTRRPPIHPRHAPRPARRRATTASSTASTIVKPSSEANTIRLLATRAAWRRAWSCSRASVREQLDKEQLSGGQPPDKAEGQSRRRGALQAGPGAAPASR